MNKIKFKNYKPFNGCPKCGDYTYEASMNEFDFFTHKNKEYVAVHCIATCNCGHHFTYDEIYKYCCEAVKEQGLTSQPFYGPAAVLPLSEYFVFKKFEKRY